METELTKRIKKLTHYYRPKLNSNMRTIRWADECWTPTGIVDSIRFEDYNATDRYICRLIDYEQAPKSMQQTAAMICHHELSECFRDHTKEKSEKKCRGCVFKSHVYDIGMMITCFETKITYSDFKSKNGHNFHGNENYYCVPKELAPKIANEVPDDIGILTYIEGEKAFGLRKYRKSGWHDVSDETKVQLLYNAMKKWCDGASFPIKPD